MGKPRVPIPPGLGAKAAAVKPAVKAEAAAAFMEVEVIEEVTLEDMIAEVEDNLKLLKGKETVWAKAQKSDLEVQLKVMKEQQRLARPLQQGSRLLRTGSQSQGSRSRPARQRLRRSAKL